MPERGGPTTQSGILYQNAVAALFLGQLCDERQGKGARVISVRVEAPGAVDDTVVTFADHHVVYIQSKERIAESEEAWVKLWKDFAVQYQSDQFTRHRDRLRLQLGTPAGRWEALRDLADRARTSATTKEWNARLSKLSHGVREDLKLLLPPTLAASDETLREFLGHLDVEVWTPRMVEEDLANAHMPPTNVKTATLFALLRDMVGGGARLRGTFIAPELRTKLESAHGVVFESPADEEALLRAVRHTGAVLRQHKNSLGRTSVHIKRSIVGDLVDWTTRPDAAKPVAMLLDSAGYGKTVALRDVVEALEQLGVPAIAIKADQQLSRVASATELPSRLGLPASIETVASRLSVRGPVAVIIDQVDALSMSLARDQAALEVVLGLVARLRGIPGVGVLLSCRTFDRNTDPRLKSLEIGREFRLPLLAPEQIKDVLEPIGVSVARLTPATVELLRIPLHLDIFATLVESAGKDTARLHGLHSLQDLYTELWDRFVLGPGPQTGEARENALRIVTARMNRDQRIATPKSVLLAASPEIAAATSTLISNGILVVNGPEVTFLHQTFFDYCFARFFVQDGSSISDVLLSSNQGLFERSQVVQVLGFLRATDARAYLRELAILLTADGLRAHLRTLLLSWLGSVERPTDGEWILAQRLLAERGSRARVLRALSSNPGWFERLDGGVLKDYLEEDAGWIDEHVVPYIAESIEVAQPQAVAVVKSWLARGPVWIERAVRVVQSIRSWRTPELAELYAHLLEVAPPERLRWLIVQLDDLAVADPHRAVYPVRAALARILDAYRGRSENERKWVGWGRELSEIGGHSLVAALEAVSETASVAFLDEIVPWIVATVQQDLGGQNPEDIRLFQGDVFARGHLSHNDDEGQPLIRAVHRALVRSISEGGSRAQEHLRRLADTGTATTQRIAAMVYRDLASKFATQGLRFLLEHSGRFQLGDGGADLSAGLIRALIPQLSPADVLALEQSILVNTGHLPEWSRSVDGLRGRGIDQLSLLEAVGVENLSEGTKRRLAELRRKFPEFRPRNTRATIQGGFVGSPIDGDALDRMPVRHWLRAMERYSRGHEHREFLRGGARELASELEHRIKARPAEYFALAMQVPVNADEAYVTAILRGLGDSDCPPDWILDVAARFGFTGGAQVLQATARALQKTTARGHRIPAALRELLRSTVMQAAGDDEDLAAGFGRDPYHRCINSLRGVALEALLQDLRREESRESTASYWDLVDVVARDASVALRSGALVDITYMLARDPERAVSAFERLSKNAEELRISVPFHNFLYHACFRRFGLLARYVQEVMNAADPESRQRGAEIATVYRISPGAMESQEAERLATEMYEQAVGGEMRWRAGVAKVLAHNLNDAPARLCAVELQRLLNDDEKEVRANVASMLHRVRSYNDAETRNLLLAFAGSRSLWSGLLELSDLLWERADLLPQWSLDVVDAILSNETSSEEVWQRTVGGERLVRLVLRLIADPTNEPGLTRRALDLFDRLMDRYAAEASAALAEWDRR